MSSKIDLLALAADATWKSGRLTDANNTTENTKLDYGKNPADRRAGFAGRRSVKTEDGKSQQVLHTHPRWTRNGTIKGWLPWRKLPANARFYADVGFIDGARGSDGVRFQVWEHHKENGKEVWNRVVNVHKKYDGKLRRIEADLSHLAGQDVGIELRVDAGASSGQDWAVWVAPRVEPKATAAHGMVLGLIGTRPLITATGLAPHLSNTSTSTAPATDTVSVQLVPVANWDYVAFFDVGVRHATTDGRDELKNFRFRKGSPPQKLQISLPKDEHGKYYTRVTLHQRDRQKVEFGWVERKGNQTLKLGTGHRPPPQPTTEQVILTIVPTLDWNDFKAVSVRARYQGPNGPTQFRHDLQAGAAPSTHPLQVAAAAQQTFETMVLYTNAAGRVSQDPWRERKGNFVLMIPEQRSTTLRLEAAGDWSSIEHIDIELIPLDGPDGSAETETLRLVAGQAIERTVQVDGNVSVTATYRLHVRTKADTWWITPWMQHTIEDTATLELSPPPPPQAAMGSLVTTTLFFDDAETPPQTWYPFGRDPVEAPMGEELGAFLRDLLLGRSPGDEIDQMLAADAFGAAPAEAPTLYRVPRAAVGDDPVLGQMFETEDDQPVYFVGFDGDEALLQATDPLAGKTLRARGRVIGIEAPSAEPANQ